jgi:DNA polymerase III subunit gamma/tau
MYVVFARKYRPQTFGDVIGQQHIALTLQNAVRNDRVAHAYLFCGSRGVGKTTVARLLAKALNCEQGPTPDPCGRCDSCLRVATGDDLDVLEIDGASSRGIDEVRELRQSVRLAPARSRYRIFYIDEVHMLTGPAFNALLKTLEEPPPHVKFMFSTTDPQKMPETVKSRCQRFDFRRIGDADIIGWLDGICEKEGLKVEDGGLAAIARSARGGMRDALGALDQLASFGNEIALKDVLAVLGAVDASALVRVVDALAAEDTGEALHAVHDVLFAGTDVTDFADQLSLYLRDVLVAGCCGAGDSLLDGATADADTLQRHAETFAPDQITYMIQLLRAARLRAARETTGRLALELAIIKMSRLSELIELSQAVSDVKAGGAATSALPPKPRQGRRSPPSDPQGASAKGASQPPPRSRMDADAPTKQQEEPARVPVERAKCPDGVSDVMWRKLRSVADDVQTAEGALADKSLLAAFLTGSTELGLEPVRLERTAVPEEEEEQTDD